MNNNFNNLGQNVGNLFGGMLGGLAGGLNQAGGAEGGGEENPFAQLFSAAAQGKDPNIADLARTSQKPTENLFNNLNKLLHVEKKEKFNPEVIIDQGFINNPLVELWGCYSEKCLDMEKEMTLVEKISFRCDGYVDDNFIRVLKDSPRLDYSKTQVVDFTGCTNLTDVGMEWLAEMLSVSNSLHSISIDGCIKVTHIGLCFLGNIRTCPELSFSGIDLFVTPKRLMVSPDPISTGCPLMPKETLTSNRSDIARILIHNPSQPKYSLTSFLLEKHMEPAEDYVYTPQWSYEGTNYCISETTLTNPLNDVLQNNAGSHVLIPVDLDGNQEKEIDHIISAIDYNLSKDLPSVSAAGNLDKMIWPTRLVNGLWDDKTGTLVLYSSFFMSMGAILNTFGNAGGNEISPEDVFGGMGAFRWSPNKYFPTLRFVVCCPTDINPNQESPKVHLLVGLKTEDSMEGLMDVMEPFLAGEGDVITVGLSDPDSLEHSHVMDKETAKVWRNGEEVAEFECSSADLYVALYAVCPSVAFRLLDHYALSSLMDGRESRPFRALVFEDSNAVIYDDASSTLMNGDEKLVIFYEGAIGMRNKSFEFEILSELSESQEGQHLICGLAINTVEEPDDVDSLLNENTFVQYNSKLGTCKTNNGDVDSPEAANCSKGDRIKFEVSNADKLFIGLGETYNITIYRNDKVVLETSFKFTSDEDEPVVSMEYFLLVPAQAHIHLTDTGPRPAYVTRTCLTNALPKACYIRPHSMERNDQTGSSHVTCPEGDTWLGEASLTFIHPSFEFTVCHFDKEGATVENGVFNFGLMADALATIPAAHYIHEVTDAKVGDVFELRAVLKGLTLDEYNVPTLGQDIHVIVKRNGEVVEDTSFHYKGGGIHPAITATTTTNYRLENMDTDESYRIMSEGTTSRKRFKIVGVTGEKEEKACEDLMGDMEKALTERLQTHLTSAQQLATEVKSNVEYSVSPFTTAGCKTIVLMDVYRRNLQALLNNMSASWAFLPVNIVTGEGHNELLEMIHLDQYEIKAFRNGFGIPRLVDQILAKIQSEENTFKILTRDNYREFIDVPEGELVGPLKLIANRGRILYFGQLDPWVAVLDIAWFVKTLRLLDTAPDTKAGLNVPGFAPTTPVWTDREIGKLFTSQVPTQQVKILLDLFLRKNLILRLPAVRSQTTDAKSYIAARVHLRNPEVPLEHFYDPNKEEGNMLNVKAKFKCPLPVATSTKMGVLFRSAQICKPIVITPTYMVTQHGAVQVLLLWERTEGDFDQLIINAKAYKGDDAGGGDEDSPGVSDFATWYMMVYADIAASVLLSDQVIFITPEMPAQDPPPCHHDWKGTGHTVAKLSVCTLCGNCSQKGISCEKNRIVNTSEIYQCKCQPFILCCQTCGICPKCVSTIWDAQCTVRPSLETGRNMSTMRAFWGSFSTNNVLTAPYTSSEITVVKVGRGETAKAINIGLFAVSKAKFVQLFPGRGLVGSASQGYHQKSRSIITQTCIDEDESLDFRTGDKITIKVGESTTKSFDQDFSWEKPPMEVNLFFSLNCALSRLSNTVKHTRGDVGMLMSQLPLSRDRFYFEAEIVTLPEGVVSGVGIAMGKEISSCIGHGTGHKATKQCTKWGNRKFAIGDVIGCGIRSFETLDIIFTHNDELVCEHSGMGEKGKASAAVLVQPDETVRILNSNIWKPDESEKEMKSWQSTKMPSNQDNFYPADGSLIICPKESLMFNMPADKATRSYSLIHVENRIHTHIIWKVKVNKVERFTTDPIKGIINPNEVITIRAELKTKDEQPIENVKVQFIWTRLPEYLFDAKDTSKSNSQQADELWRKMKDILEGNQRVHMMTCRWRTNDGAYEQVNETNFVEELLSTKYMPMEPSYEVKVMKNEDLVASYWLPKTTEYKFAVEKNTDQVEENAVDKDVIVHMPRFPPVLQTFHRAKPYHGSPMKASDLEDMRTQTFTCDPRKDKYRKRLQYADEFRNKVLNYKLCTITSEEIADIEAKTRGQAGNKHWALERGKRITSSNFGTVCKATSRRDISKLAAELVTPKSDSEDIDDLCKGRTPTEQIVRLYNSLDDSDYRSSNPKFGWLSFLPDKLSLNDLLYPSLTNLHDAAALRAYAICFDHSHSFQSYKEIPTGVHFLDRVGVRIMNTDTIKPPYGIPRIRNFYVKMAFTKVNLPLYLSMLSIKGETSAAQVESLLQTILSIYALTGDVLYPDKDGDGDGDGDGDNIPPTHAIKFHPEDYSFIESCKGSEEDSSEDVLRDPYLILDATVEEPVPVSQLAGTTAKRPLLQAVELDIFDSDHGKKFKLNLPEVKALILRKKPESEAKCDITMENCSELERLEIYNNDVPLKLDRCPLLSVLRIIQGPFTKLPERFGDLCNLRYLELDECRLESLPLNFSLLKSLTQLIIRGKRIDKDPMISINKRASSAALKSGGEKVEKKDLEDDEEQDPNLYAATKYYRDRRLGHDYKDGDMHGGFPRQILQLVNLEILDLSFQAMKFIPRQISRLVNLRELKLRSCLELKHLPSTLGSLSIVSLNLKYCVSLRTPSRDIVDRGTEAVLAYLKQMEGGEARNWRTKLMLVGIGGAGKTTLLQALMSDHHTAAGTRAGDITLGINIETWRAKNEKKYPGRHVTFSVWDFAGQTVFYNTHQFFLSDRAVYMLVWSGRQGYENSSLDFWLSSIQAHAPDAPIFIVASHGDQLKTEIPKTQLKEAYPQIVAFFCVGSTTGMGISELKDSLLETALGLEYMGEEVPRSFLDLEETFISLRGSSSAYLDWKTVEEHAAAGGIFNHKDVVQAVKFLHEVGSVQYFDYEVLREYIIIDPQWIVNAMASIVTFKNTAIKSGRLRHRHLHKVWYTEQYPKELHDWLLRLTEKFDLTFEVEDDTSLVPCLLPHDKSVEAQWPPKQAKDLVCLTIVYVFRYLPTGLFNRLQARLFEFSNSRSVWKNGSTLEKNGHYALLSQDRERKMTVEVMGPCPEGIIFLIHETLEELINSSYRGVSFEYLIPCPDCITSVGVAESAMFEASLIRAASTLNVPYIQCRKLFHTVPMTVCKALMPPNDNLELDLQLQRSMHVLTEMKQSIKTDVFVLYCQQDLDSLDNPKTHACPQQLTQILEKKNFKCYFKQDMKPSDAHVLMVSMQEASTLLVFMSNALAKDSHCSALLQYALQRFKERLVVVNIEQDPKWKMEEVGYNVGQEVYTNMRKNEGDEYKQGLQALESTLSQKLNRKKASMQADSVCFLSYAWDNSAQAKKGRRKKEGAITACDPRSLKQDIEKHGIKCWLDIEQTGKRGLFEDITEGLKVADVFVACVSEEYTRSSNCMMEFRFAAVNLMLPIIVVAVGTGKDWLQKEVGMLAGKADAPIVYMQEAVTQEKIKEVVNFIKSNLLTAEKRAEKLAEMKKRNKQTSIEELINVSFQEEYELAQRKIMRLVMRLTSEGSSVKYPHLIVLDFVGKKPDQTDGSSKSQDKRKTLVRRRTSMLLPVFNQGEATEEANQNRNEESKVNLHQNMCIRYLCEHDQGWHLSDSYVELTELSVGDKEALLAMAAPYMARILPLLDAPTSEGHALVCLQGDSTAFKHHVIRLALESERDFDKSYQDFQEIALRHDKTISRGNLARCVLSGGRIRWLCPAHAQARRVTVLAIDSNMGTSTQASRSDHEQNKAIFESLSKAERLRKPPKCDIVYPRGEDIVEVLTAKHRGTDAQTDIFTTAKTDEEIRRASASGSRKPMTPVKEATTRPPSASNTSRPPSASNTSRPPTARPIPAPRTPSAQSLRSLTSTIGEYGIDSMPSTRAPSPAGSTTSQSKGKKPKPKPKTTLPQGQQQFNPGNMSEEAAGQAMMQAMMQGMAGGFGGEDGDPADPNNPTSQACAIL